MNTSEAAFETLTPLTPLMDKCVHCGFCLSTCPSYLLLGQEMDSPRGRIYLMKAGTEGRVGVSEAFVEHFDTCLGCMACETACPSGVRYAPLIEETRAVVEHHHRRPIGERLFRQLLFQPGFHPVGKPDVIQEQAQDQNDEDQQKKRNSAPFESGEEDSQAARADFFPLRSIP